MMKESSCHSPKQVEECLESQDINWMLMTKIQSKKIARIYTKQQVTHGVVSKPLKTPSAFKIKRREG